MKILSQSGPFTNLSLIVIWFLFPFYDALYYSWTSTIARSRILHKILHKNFGILINGLIELQNVNFLKFGLLWELHLIVCRLLFLLMCSVKANEELQKLRKKNKIHFVICCCLRNRACIYSPPPSHIIETLYLLFFSPDFKWKKPKQTKPQAASLCPPPPPPSPQHSHNPQCNVFWSL